MAEPEIIMRQGASHQTAVPAPDLAYIPPSQPSVKLGSPYLPVPTPTSTVGFTADKLQLHRVQSAIKSDSVQEVERNASIAGLVIDQLNDALNISSDDTDASQWVKTLSDLKAQSKPAQTIIGVVGNTGAGKSSVINAVLEEERLVPTSCFRACTAVITELSYNHFQEPEQLYRAEIEFITLEDWTNELVQLKDDLVDSRGQILKDSAGTDSEAGVAWAKIHAVYPKLRKEDLPATDLETLTNDSQVRDVLGATKHVAEPAVDTFYSRLHKYIDSKQGKSSRRGRKKKDKKKSETEEHSLEYWPLVKVVRVYTKAKALSTGAIIVDLPGVQDSNAARAAVAQKYIENCSGLWIVAPISRAVSDKTAQHLLGAAFKLQLKYDSSFSNITFIASKADDISISEAMRDLESLEDSDDHEALFNRFDEVQEGEQIKKDELFELERGLRAAQASLEEIEGKLDAWKKLSARQDNGEIVFEPEILPKKRLAPREIAARDTPVGKRTRLETVRRGDGPIRGYKEESDSNGDSDGSDISSGTNVTREPLSHHQVQSKLEEYEAARVEASRLVNECEELTAPVRQQHHDLETEMSEIQPEVKAICIKSRNEQSREAIREDFARGVRDSDQENVDEAELDPDDELRDYDGVAASLPVFCVSSFAYQTLSGRFREDGGTPGFQDPNETEIPQLQAHAMRMTESTRVQAARKFLNHFCHQLNSLAMWTRAQKAQNQLTANEKEKELAHIRSASAEVAQTLFDVANDTVRECEQAFAKHLFSSFQSASRKATAKAVEIADAWGKDRHDGGLAYQTYKATCRRYGAFSGAAGHRNFNEELIQPLKTAFANKWERVFAKIVPQALKNFSNDAQRIMNQSHDEHKTRLQSKINHTDIIVLDTQMQARCHVVSDMVSELNTKVTALQRGANREFTPVIVEALARAYGTCVTERGTGAFMRMKEAMRTHIAGESDTMYLESCKKVKESLLTLCNEIRQDMHYKINEVVAAMAEDYHTVVVGRELSQASKGVRLHIQKLLSQVDTSFETGRIEAIFLEDGHPGATLPSSDQLESMIPDANTIKDEADDPWYSAEQNPSPQTLPAYQLSQSQQTANSQTPTAAIDSMNSSVHGTIFPNLPGT